MTSESNPISCGNIAGMEETVKYNIEKNLPYFVFVESVPQIKEPDGQPHDEKYLLTGKIAFCGKDMAPIYSLGKRGYYTLGTLETNFISKYLHRTRPMKNEDGSGWIIPLYEGNDFRSQRSVNAYFHNLMFWESQLPNDSSGPLTLRLINSLIKENEMFPKNSYFSFTGGFSPYPWMSWNWNGGLERMREKMMVRQRMEELRDEINKKVDILKQTEVALRQQAETKKIYERECERLGQSTAVLRSDIHKLKEELNTLSENALQE